MAGRQRLSPILLEAYRGLWGHRVMAIIIGGVSAVSAAAVVVGVVLTFTNLSSIWSTKVERGVNVWVVTSSSPRSVPAASCDALRGVEGVAAAGAVIDSRTTAFSISPASPVVLSRVTPGYIQIAFPDSKLAIPGTTLGLNAAQVSGAVSGATLWERDGTSEPLSVGFVSSAQIERVTGSNNAVLVPTVPTGFTNACYVEAKPGYRLTLAAALASWFPPSESWVVAPLIAPENFEVDVSASMRHTPWLFVAPSLALMTLLVSAIMWWSRRQEFALYRLLGFSTRALLVIISLEWIVSVVMPAVLGALAGFAVSPPTDIDHHFLLHASVITALFFIVLLCGPPIALLMVRSSRVGDVLKGA